MVSIQRQALKKDVIKITKNPNSILFEPIALTIQQNQVYGYKELKYLLFTTKDLKKSSFLEKPKSRIWKFQQFYKFYEKNLTKPKLFVGGYLLISEKEMPKYLSSIDHNGKGEERERVKRKVEEEE